mgnify:CR=1 FL=1
MRRIVLTLLLATLLLPASAQTVGEEESVERSVYLEQEDQAIQVRGDFDFNAEALAQEILSLTNEARRRNGLPGLKRHVALVGAAGEHSREMRRLNYFSHTSPTAGRETARKRVQMFGLNPRVVAENIFECSGYDLNMVARIAVESFLNSPGHRKNMMSGTITHIGIGVFESDGSVSVTQVFGAL